LKGERLIGSLSMHFYHSLLTTIIPFCQIRSICWLNSGLLLPASLNATLSDEVRFELILFFKQFRRASFLPFFSFDFLLHNMNFVRVFQSRCPSYCTYCRTLTRRVARAWSCPKSFTL
jgi:hypothetical protein